MTRYAQVSRLAIAVTLAATLGACDSAGGQSSSADPGLTAMVNELIDQAREAGASSIQIALLEQAQVEGAVSLSLLTDAVNATLACMDDASIGHSVATDTDQPLPLLVYTYESPEAGNPIAEKCIVVNSYFVEAAYQNQPSWQAVLDGRIVANRDAIIACLDDLGVDIALNATPDEITQATRISTEELHEYLDAGSRVPVDCLVDYGAN